MIDRERSPGDPPADAGADGRRMTRSTAVAALTAVVVGGFLPGGTDSALPVVSAPPLAVGVSATPHITVVGAGEAQRATLHDALGRFREHGLDLPDLEVRFSGDQADCHGHVGGFDERRRRVVVCSELPFVLTHELAHAWAAANLDDTDRDRYLDARGLTTWDDREAPWNERGVEDAAFVIQQNLTATNPPLSSPTWAQRAAAYELLTGSTSPLRDGAAARRR